MHVHSIIILGFFFVLHLFCIRLSAQDVGQTRKPVKADGRRGTVHASQSTRSETLFTGLEKMLHQLSDELDTASRYLKAALPDTEPSLAIPSVVAFQPPLEDLFCDVMTDGLDIVLHLRCILIADLHACYTILYVFGRLNNVMLPQLSEPNLLAAYMKDLHVLLSMSKFSVLTIESVCNYVETSIIIKLQEVFQNLSVIGFTPVQQPLYCFAVMYSYCLLTGLYCACKDPSFANSPYLAADSPVRHLRPLLCHVPKMADYLAELRSIAMRLKVFPMSLFNDIQSQLQKAMTIDSNLTAFLSISLTHNVPMECRIKSWLSKGLEKNFVLSLRLVSGMFKRVTFILMLFKHIRDAGYVDYISDMEASMNVEAIKTSLELSLSSQDACYFVHTQQLLCSVTIEASSPSPMPSSKQQSIFPRPVDVFEYEMIHQFFRLLKTRVTKVFFGQIIQLQKAYQDILIQNDHVKFNIDHRSSVVQVLAQLESLSCVFKDSASPIIADFELSLKPSYMITDGFLHLLRRAVDLVRTISNADDTACLIDWKGLHAEMLLSSNSGVQSLLESLNSQFGEEQRKQTHDFINISLLDPFKKLLLFTDEQENLASNLPAESRKKAAETLARTIKSAEDLAHALLLEEESLNMLSSHLKRRKKVILNVAYKSLAVEKSIIALRDEIERLRCGIARFVTFHKLYDVLLKSSLN